MLSQRSWQHAFLGVLLLAAVFVAGIVLSACERPATVTSWAPIETSQALETRNAQSTKTTPNPSLPAPTATLAPPFPTPEGLPLTLPSSMKGYELYSWQNGAEWNFTLITGTNRSKSFDEIIAQGNTISADGFIKISVTGMEEIQKVLGLLSKGEQVFWAGMDLGGQVPSGTVYLTFPSQKMIDDLMQFCSDHKITLQILKES